MAERVGVRSVTSEEGNRPLRIVRRSTGSVVTWRRAQDRSPRRRVGDRAHPNNVEPAYVPFYASWWNRHTHDRRLSEIVNRAEGA